RLRLFFVDCVRERVAELVVGERNRLVVVGGVAQHRRARPQRRERQRQDAAERRRADRDRAKASPRPARISVSRPPKEWPMTAGLRPSRRITDSKWSATSPIDFPAN